jgi:hypothetical protein
VNQNFTTQILAMSSDFTSQIMQPNNDFITMVNQSVLISEVAGLAPRFNGKLG